MYINDTKIKEKNIYIYIKERNVPRRLSKTCQMTWEQSYHQEPLARPDWSSMEWKTRRIYDCWTGPGAPKNSKALLGLPVITIQTSLSMAMAKYRGTTGLKARASPTQQVKGAWCLKVHAQEPAISVHGGKTLHPGCLGLVPGSQPCKDRTSHRKISLNNNNKKNHWPKREKYKQY